MKRDGFGSKFIGALAKYGKTLEFDGFTVLVRPASVARAREFQKAQKAFHADGDDDKLNDVVIGAFIEYCCDPETGEPAFTKGDKQTVMDSVPMPVILKVVQAAVGVDAEQAAKN